MTMVEYRVEHRFRRQPAHASAFRRFTVSPFQSRRGCGSTDHRLVRRSIRGGGNASTPKVFASEALPWPPEPWRRRRRFNGLRRAAASRRAVALREGWLREGGFTLLELLIVVGIIGLLLVLMAPAFTTIRGGTDVTSAAYTIKGVLDTARTYAKANNTYTWVGFFEEDAPQPSMSPANSGTGRIVMSIVASKDGTMLYTGNLGSPFTLDASPNQAALIQVGKLTKVDNVHLKTFADAAPSPTPPVDTFDTRPLAGSNPYPDLTARIGDTTGANTAPPNPYLTFHYPVGSSPGQYTFIKVIQFSPRGEGVIDNKNYTLAPVSEIGVQPTHGTTVDTNSTNFVAIQFTGFGGNVKIYRK